ncbi:MAG: hypothetical protein ACKVQC_00995, partial [Elusimicrobiota bacterium]
MIIINKRAHPFVQQLRFIRDRKEKNLLFCEGEDLLSESLRSGVTIQSVVCVSEKLKSCQTKLKRFQKSADFYVLDESVMKFVSDVVTPPGIISIVEKPSFSSLDEKLKGKTPFFLLLHGVQLPQNVGSLFRTGEAAGIDRS